MDSRFSAHSGEGISPKSSVQFSSSRYTAVFPAVGMQFREQPFLGYSKSISSLALSKSRCHHSDHLLYSLIFLSIIKWLSILFAFLEYQLRVLYICYCMLTLLLFFYLSISVLYHLVCFPHTLRESLERAKKP